MNNKINDSLLAVRLWFYCWLMFLISSSARAFIDERQDETYKLILRGLGFTFFSLPELIVLLFTLFRIKDLRIPIKYKMIVLAVLEIFIALFYVQSNSKKNLILSICLLTLSLLFSYIVNYRKIIGYFEIEDDSSSYNKLK